MKGTITVPGDKSISHRALIFAALAIGKSEITGLLEGEDVLATAEALRAMGATIEKSGPEDNDVWTVYGVGVGGLMQPETAIDLGNSGTSVRLLMGLIASHDISVTFTGDASLSKRPMGRVIEPLSQMGAEFTARETHDAKQCLPLTVRGLCPAVPMEYRSLPVASAQVKSAILLAGLNTPAVTKVIEPVPTRDHSETMLKGFGADIRCRNGREWRSHHFHHGRNRSAIRKISPCRETRRRPRSPSWLRCLYPDRTSWLKMSASIQPVPVCLKF